MATARDIAEQVLAKATSFGEEAEGLFLPDVVNMIPSAIREMVIDIADNGNQSDRKLFQKDFTVAISVTSPYYTGDLTTSLAAAEPMYVHLPFPAVLHSSSQTGELLYKPDVSNLGFVTLEDGYDYYAVDGVVVSLNTLVALTGNLTVRSFYFPVVSALKPQFQTELVNRLLMTLGMVKQNR